MHWSIWTGAGEAFSTFWRTEYEGQGGAPWELHETIIETSGSFMLTWFQTYEIKMVEFDFESSTNDPTKSTNQPPKRQTRWLIMGHMLNMTILQRFRLANRCQMRHDHVFHADSVSVILAATIRTLTPFAIGGPLNWFSWIVFDWRGTDSRAKSAVWL